MLQNFRMSGKFMFTEYIMLTHPHMHTLKTGKALFLCTSIEASIYIYLNIYQGIYTLDLEAETKLQHQVKYGRFSINIG